MTLKEHCYYCTTDNRFIWTWNNTAWIKNYHKVCPVSGAVCQRSVSWPPWQAALPLCRSVVHAIPGASCWTLPVCPCPPSREARWPVCFNQHSVCQRAYLRRWESLCVLLHAERMRPSEGAAEWEHDRTPLSIFNAVTWKFWTLF